MNGLIGKTLGPYQIVERVGTGGMATVYKAYQPALDRMVAIKVLPAHLAEVPGFGQRFQREARAVARLEHPNILAVYDFGQQDDLSYLVMHYVEGGTVKDLLGKPLPLERVAELIGQIADALDHAHERGVIHRDVKPGNVLLDPKGRVLLTDFGLARIVQETQQITGTGVGVGTPAYMSPEQGKGTKLDRRSDVYSLGVVLHEMVTGEVPYQAETPIAVVLKHINGPLPMPRQANPAIPEAVERVVLKALAKRPEDRFQTAGEMAQALHVAVGMALLPESARAAGVAAAAKREGISLVTRVQRIWQRPQSKAALVGSVVFVLAVLGVLLIRLPYRVQIAAPGAALGNVEGVTAIAQTTPETSTPAAIPPALTTMPGAAATIATQPSAMGAVSSEEPPGERLTIRGVVRDDAGKTVPDAYVVLEVYGPGASLDWDAHHFGSFGSYTDGTGSYSFDKIVRLEGGEYQVWFNGRHHYGKAYENSGYYIEEDEISGNLYVLHVTVHAVTGSVLSAAVEYEDVDGSIKDFYSPPFTNPEPDHFVALSRGTPDNTEYAIGAEYGRIGGGTVEWTGLAGGTYYLSVTYRRLDGVLVQCNGPSFQIPPGGTKRLEFTVRDCLFSAQPVLP